MTPATQRRISKKMWFKSPDCRTCQGLGFLACRACLGSGYHCDACEGALTEVCASCMNTYYACANA